MGNSYLPQELIRKKALDGTWEPEEIRFLIGGIADGSLADSQVGALAMAIFLKGLSAPETAELTLAMRDSGQVLQWDLPGPVIDKHSTGGVGDLVSLTLGPMVAACGGYVPMISGRGLGHTGGTLDKLDSIPGFQTQLDIEKFRSVVKDVHLAIVGQTSDLAPADKKLYSIRDVTGTVASIPLITASILSKKLAAGLQGLCMDVKTGNGAFMETKELSIQLAESIANVCFHAGIPIASIVTDMSQPLASCAGNVVEVVYAIDYLTGVLREPRFHEIVMKLSSELLVLSGIHTDIDESRIKLESVLNSGKAAEIFERMVYAQGGGKNFLTTYKKDLRWADYQSPIIAEKTGYISSIETRELGLIVVGLGGGRKSPGEAIDFRVGLTEIAELGRKVEEGDVIGIVWGKSAEDAGRFAKQASNCFQIENECPKLPELVLNTFIRS
ncbi:MAG: thymidine phosphorylase [Leptospira sp.]|nr:thymidine phosphorylase [Leptospira sp.]